MAFASRERRHLVTALALSVVAHAALSAVGASMLRAPPVVPLAVPSPVLLVGVQIELPELPAGSLVAPPAPLAVAPELSAGGERLARPDSGRAGRGGSRRVDAPAVNLAPRDDEAQLSPSLRSRVDRAQQSRSRSGRLRRSIEDDRLTPHPMMATFVADGPWWRPDGWWRRPPAEVAAGAHATKHRDAAAMREWVRGVLTRSPSPGTGALAVALAAAGHAAGSANAGSLGAAARPAGATETRSRPQVLAGGESSPANQRGAQSDTVDAEQEVSAMSPSLLRASTAGGLPGSGRGGEQGPGQAASGGQRGPGALASVLGAGGRGVVSVADRRRRHYLRGMWSKIHASWSSADFPRWAALAGRQGYTIVGFVVLANGTVGGVRVLRPSGVAEFDARMVLAVLRAAPFGPLPAELGPMLRHTHEFVINNPAVRPLRPAAGP